MKLNLLEYWKKNIQDNIKTISAVLSLIITKVIGIIFLGIRLGLDGMLIMILIITITEPFIIIWLRIIFTGEAMQTQLEKDLLLQENKYLTQIAEYRVVLAAKTGNVEDVIRRNMDFNEANAAVEKLEKKE